MVDLSAFSDVIKIENPLKTENSSGGNSESYTVICTTKASVTKKDGYREFRDGFDGMIGVYEVLCHWRMDLEKNIEKDTRIEYKGKKMRMESWEVVGKHPYYIKMKVSEIE